MVSFFFKGLVKFMEIGNFEDLMSKFETKIGRRILEARNKPGVHDSTNLVHAHYLFSIVFLAPFLSFFSRYLFRCIFFLAAVKSWVLIMAKA